MVGNLHTTVHQQQQEITKLNANLAMAMADRAIGGNLEEIELLKQRNMFLEEELSKKNSILCQLTIGGKPEAAPYLELLAESKKFKYAFDAVWKKNKELRTELRAANDANTKVEKVDVGVGTHNEIETYECNSGSGQHICNHASVADDSAFIEPKTGNNIITKLSFAMVTQTSKSMIVKRNGAE
ncbi:hypothetical protein HDU76_008952 [Blyttiomyces sp. JEL0837]|nr:hypothetical protein HDU76_008952 [Blyttiomyces sp. JEL0837]